MGDIDIRDDRHTAEGAVTLYTTTWCGYCVRLKRQLDDAGIGYREVDVEADPRAAQFVMGVNGGNRTVPTVVLPGGRALTNPSLKELREIMAQA